MKKLYKWLIYTVLFIVIGSQLQAQTIINAPNLNKNSKLQLGLAEVFAVKQNNINAVLSESNVPLYSLQNFKENNSKIRVDIISKGNGDVLYAELLNLNIEIVARQQNYFTCWAEITQLNNYLNKAPSISFMRSSLKALNNAGIVQSQGDAAQRSNLARALGVNGAGVKVGVLSDSYNHKGGAAAGVANGELPGTGNPAGFTTDITVLAEMTNPGGSDEGRAMLEIIHDVAPGAQLYYYTAFNGQTDFAAGIKALADAGCDIIVDDVFYYAEPMFQDGIIAQAVDYAVNEKGATYFSSAGNYSNRSYDAAYQGTTFEPFGAGQGMAHNFGTDADPIYYLPVAKTNSSAVVVALQWDEPFLSAGNGSPGSASDLDLALLTYDGSVYSVIATSFADNINGDPVELAQVFGSGTFYVAVVRYSGPDPTHLKLNFYGSINWDTSTPSNIVGIKAGSTVGHSNATGAIATGAAHYVKTPAFGVNPPEVESFSSKGGTKVIFSKEGIRLASPIDRFKPEITAPDGANNSFFGYDSEPDGFPNFFGTSAAAPHAAAVAALMLEAEPSYTPANILTELRNSSTDMDDPTTPGFDIGFDYATGAGLIKADVAVQAAINSFCKISLTQASQVLSCAGLNNGSASVNLVNNGPQSYTYDWTPGNPTGDGTPSVTGLSPGTYTCTVSDGNFCTAEVGFNITETLPLSYPFYTEYLDNVYACEAGSAELIVNPLSFGGSASGFQWQVNTGSGFSDLTESVDFEGVNNDSLLIHNITNGLNNYQYRAVISNVCNSINSDTTLLKVNQLPAIVTEPVGQNVCVGNQTTLSVVADGSGLSYQWQLNDGTGFSNVSSNGNYSNVNTPNLRISNISNDFNNYAYRCVVFNSCQSINSSSAVIQVDPTITILGQPGDQAVCQNGNIAFVINEVNISGGSTVYQWQRSTNNGLTYGNISNNSVYSGVNTRTLNLVNIPASLHNSRYRCLINNYCQSSGALLSVIPIATVTSQPTNVEICEGNNAIFNIQAAGVGLTYRWQVKTNASGNFVNVTDGGIYQGATTQSLQLSFPSASNNENQYRCLVWGTSSCDVTADTSSVAIMTVGIAAEAQIISWNSPISTNVGVTQAVGYIVGINDLIAPDGKAEYRAGNSILLNPGFEVQQGAVFKAIIRNPCQTTVINENSPIPKEIVK
ncbi:Subtilase family protein [Spirosomataceae bacterium TFI 002]|nr:Subtilase family protein [Spirosomataceae bacterium TFI 002]